MKSRLIFFLLLLLAGCAYGSEAVELHPNLPAHVVFRPTFLTRDYSFTSGTGFLVEGKSTSSSFLVTVHHIFGPVGGLEEQFSGDLIPAVFLRAVGFSFDQKPLLLTTDEGVPVHDARKADTKGSERDIALFRVRGWSANKSLELVSKPPAVAEKVWLVLRDTARNNLRFAEATVAYESSTEIRYLLTNADLNYSGASGAPVVNAAGEVVGMHIGLFTSKSGRTFGFACPAAAIREVLPND